MKKNIICINCPVGCYLTVNMESGKVLSVEGNSCKRGVEYAEKECTNPERIVITTVGLRGGELKVLPVKTKEPIPKGKIFDCIKALADVEAVAPVRIGDVIAKDVCGAFDVVATRNVAKRV